MLPLIPGCSFPTLLPQFLLRSVLPSIRCLPSLLLPLPQSVPRLVLPPANSDPLLPTPGISQIAGIVPAAIVLAVAETIFANAPASNWHTQIRRRSSETAQSCPRLPAARC